MNSCGVSGGNNSLIDMEEELEREKDEIRERVNAKYPKSDISNNLESLRQIRETPDFPKTSVASNEPSGILREANLYEDKLAQLRKKISKIQTATFNARNTFHQTSNLPPTGGWPTEENEDRIKATTEQ